MDNAEHKPAPSDSPFDFDELLGRCVGRRDLLEKVLVNFADLLPPQLAQLDQAAAQGDLAKVRNMAHRLKGGALTISAQRLSKCAVQVEAAAGKENPAALAQSLAELREESDRLTTFVRARLKKE